MGCTRGYFFLKRKTHFWNWVFHSLGQTEMGLIQKGLVKSLSPGAVRAHVDGGGEQVGSSTEFLRFAMWRPVALPSLMSPEIYCRRRVSP